MLQSAKTVYQASGEFSGVGIARLDLLADKAKKVIFETKTKFPYTLFPTKITICPNRITISYNSGFSSYEVPMMLESITGAEVTRGILFSSLNIETFGIKPPSPINYLNKKDARMARRYILALIECKKNNIELSDYSVITLRKKLKEIGKVYK